MGVTCSHTVPVPDAFVDMNAPEQFLYYVVSLKNVIALADDAGSRIGDVYIDFGCRVKATWLRFLGKHGADLSPGCADVRILVNWMHGNSHDLKCQLKNHGRYTEGAGRCFGENVEQLWAMMKHVGAIVRYMTHEHRRIFLEALLGIIADDKQMRMVGLLDIKFKRMRGLLGENNIMMDLTVRDTSTCI
jgi:hypothetical protein